LVDKLKRKMHEEKLRKNEKITFLWTREKKSSGIHGKLVIGRRIEEKNIKLDIVMMKKETLKKN